DGISFASEPGQGQVYMFLDTFLPVAVLSFCCGAFSLRKLCELKLQADVNGARNCLRRSSPAVQGLRCLRKYPFIKAKASSFVS
ncbi:MAG TPA: hypothetical protein PL110_16490, partial [Candidatus Eremiobacteraeota bacterium]|nr:hypothetical protein [Candidatus Eremiobacteraeota bacterium]